MAKAGYKNVICFSGSRNGMDDETGLKNCAEGLQKILPLAEKNGVIIQMELLNSKIDHKDYMCDRTSWRPWRPECENKLCAPGLSRSAPRRCRRWRSGEQPAVGALDRCA